MNLLDCFYEEILIPVLESLGDAAIRVLDWLLLAVICITVPAWIVPYLIMRKSKGDTDEGSE